MAPPVDSGYLFMDQGASAAGELVNGHVVQSHMELQSYGSTRGALGEITIVLCRFDLLIFRAIGKSGSVGKVIPIQCEHRKTVRVAVLTRHPLKSKHLREERPTAARLELLACLGVF